MIRGLSQTDLNYGIAVDLLFSRYHDVRVVVDAHISEILKLEIKSEPGTKADLRMFYDKCETHIRALKALGRNVDAAVGNDTLPACEVIVPILKRKLPEGPLRKWETQMLRETSDTSVSRFLKFLKEEVRLEERMKLVTAQPEEQNSPAAHKSPKPKGKRNRKRYEKEDSDVSAAFAGSILRRCPFCEKDCHEKIEQCKAIPYLAHSWKLFITRRYGLCYQCMVSKHAREECKEPSCGVANCKYRHHKLLHQSLNEAESKEVKRKEVKGNAAASSGRGTGILQTVQAQLLSPKGSFLATVLLDPGSDTSFIRESLAERAGLDGKFQRVYLDTVGSQERMIESKTVSFQLTPIGDKSRAKKVTALTLKHVASVANLQKVCLDRYPHLKNLSLAPQPEGSMSVDILVGADYYYDFMLPGQFVIGGSGEPAGIGTIFGWIVSGPNPAEDERCVRRIRKCQAEIREDSASAAIERFWKFEDGGISDAVAKEKGKSTEGPSDKVHEAFRESTQFIGDRYEVRLPWKDDFQAMPDNFDVAHEWLLRSERRHRRNPKVMEAYDKAIQEYARLGFAEVVPEDEISGRPEQPSERRVWYLPHHAVIREDRETTKVRIVFNGAAKYEGVSLNENLQTGPNLLPSIVGVLLRFRCKAVAVTADIKKMFLQISIHPDDRDVLRYLWRDSDGRLLVLRFIRVIFGTNCSPFLAIGTVHYHCDRMIERFPQATAEVKRNMYMNDLASGAETAESANKLVLDCRQLLLEGGFELTKWTSNNPAALQGIAKEDQATIMLKSQGERVQKILGVTWKLRRDVLGVQKESTEPPTKFSKRSLLHDVASIFDPIGLVSPFATTGRILLQSCWKQKVGWDENLPTEIENQYSSWRKELSAVSKVEIPRFIFHDMVGDRNGVELHGFGDASGKAYGAVVYLKYDTLGHEPKLKFLLSKGRVAPIKAVTLPRLELTAAVLTAELLAFVLQEIGFPLNPGKIFAWSDSEITLHWIVGGKSSDQFVRNRVTKIRSVLAPDVWRHCAGTRNPATMTFPEARQWRS